MYVNDNYFITSHLTARRQLGEFTSLTDQLTEAPVLQVGLSRISLKRS